MDKLKFSLIFIFTLFFLAVNLASSSTVCPIGCDYTSIQAAVNNTSEGDIVIVGDGIYIENLLIDKRLTLKSENGSSNCIIQASDIDTAVIHVNASYVNISGFTIKDSWTGTGIELEAANFSRIENNTITNNWCGIEFIDSSYNNTIINNTISNGSYGIYISQGCYYNLIYINRFLNNSQNAVDDSIENYWNSTTIQTYKYKEKEYSNYTGNYWDDYSGIDSNEDGIGDEPYPIPTLGEGGEGGGERGRVPLLQAKDYYPMLLETPFPPSISNIQESGLTNESITISWQTNILANNRILYSLNPDLSSAAWSNWDNNTQNPSITFSNLLANTTYYYSVFSYRVDNTSLFSNSSIRNFTTLRNPVTWIVDDDKMQCPNANFTKIQDAVNASMNGDTILVCNGTYIENVWVNKTLNITGIDNPVVNANQAGSGFTLASNGNIVQGFYINNSGYGTCYGAVRYSGIKVGYTTYLVTGPGDCIMITDYESTDNIIRDNIFNQSGVFIVKGYIISSSDRNLITNNTFISSYLEIYGSKYNNITSNIFIEGIYGKRYIFIEGLSYKHAIGNRIENNTFTKNESDTMPMVWISNYAEQNIISGNELLGYGGIRVNSDNNQIINNTISGITPLKKDDVGIKINHASNCTLSNNTVEYKYIGLEIDSSSSYSYSTNLTLRNNTLSSNMYNFYIDPGNYEGSWGGVTDYDFDLDIDTSNTVNGLKVYYLKNESNKIYNSTTLPQAGFFACINCTNITLEGFGFNANSHGILLYNTKDSSISVFSAYNALSGVAIYNSTNITIINSTLISNGYEDQSDVLNWGTGIYFGKTNSSKIINCEITDNEIRGITFDYSHNNSINNSKVRNNGDSTYAIGLYFYEADNNVVFSNNITGTGTRQKYGFYTYDSNNNTIYNNYFNNTINANDYNGNNKWNITKTLGTNIIGGPFLGGNYWHDYTGMDIIGGDGLGDTEIPYNSSGKIRNGGDYLPLTNVAPDYTPPSIYVVSPVEGRIYGASYVYLEVYSPDPDVYKWWYSLNSGVNITFTPNTTISGLSNGAYSLRVYVNDTAGNINSSMVNFTVSIPTIGEAGEGEGEGKEYVEEEPLEEVMQPDFKILITNPENKFYSQRDFVLSFISPLPLRRASYILDQNEPEVISLAPYATSGSKEINRLLLGGHKIIVNGEDYYGKKGRGEVEFEVIPLTLGEVDIVGTRSSPRYIDDAAFSFYGRTADYILKFEAKGEVKIDVYMNKYWRDGIQSYGNLNGSLIYALQPSLSYQTYEIPVAWDNITADAENIVSFISKNAESGGAKDWEVKNVSLIPLLPFSYPEIKVFTFDKAISENESMIIIVKIDGVMNESDYNAYIYILTPDGKKLYYPEWKSEEKPINAYYLRTNYYGRLPSTLQFNNTFTPGTYILAGKITRVNSSKLLSLSTDKIYYSNQTSVKIYINRETYSENQAIVIEHMLTGNATQNGTLLLSLEYPSGEQVYLPMLSAEAKGKEYSPIKSDYFIALEELVDSNWREGVYVVRSNLYSDGGDLIAEDIQTFDVCRKQATLSGVYLRNASDNDTSPFILSRIKLLDFYTLEIIEKEFTGEHYGYTIAAPAGKYYLTGEAYSKAGKAYHIPLVQISLGCGENLTRNLALKYLSEIDLSWLPSSSSSALGLRYLSLSTLNSFDEIRVQEQNECTNPKIILYVDIKERALNKLLQEYPGDTPETLKRYFAKELKELLLKSSTGVTIYTEIERLDILREQEDYLTQNPGAEADLSKFKQTTDVEYLIGLDIDYVYVKPEEMPYFENRPESAYESYILKSELVDLDVGPLVVWGARSENRNIHRALYEIVNGPDPYLSYGDIAEHIKLHEVQYPLPPRGRISMFVTLNPESVTFEEGKDKAEIKVEVKDCRGKPVKGAKVYFKEITDRGQVKAEGKAKPGSPYYGYVYSTTNSEGIARAEYVLLLSKGVKAGVDKIDVFTEFRGRNEEHSLAIIKIAGIGLEIKAEKDEIAPQQDTNLHISLYKEEPTGEKTPLAGRGILIEKYALLDGKVVPLGAIDAHGNPVTDENGKAAIKFIAGKKTGIVKIPAVYQGLGYSIHAPRDVAFIKIKKEEFVVLVEWKQNYEYSYNWVDSGSWCGPGMGGEYCTAGTRTFNSRGGYSYNFKSQTIWERTSGSERTSADLTFKRGDSYSESWVVEWSVTSSIGREHSSYNGEVNGNVHLSLSSTRNTPTEIIIEDRRSGTLYISINPIRFYMLILGTGSGSGSESHSYSGYLVDYQFDCTSSWSGSSSYSSTHTVTYQADSINDAWSSSYSERGFQVINCPSYTLSYPHSSSSSGSHSYSLNRSWSSYPNAYKVAGGHTGSFSGYAGPYFRSSGSMLYLEYVTLKKIGRDSWEPYENHYQLSLYGEGENSASNGQLNGDIKIRVVKG
jgi:parallel beta-helix repeat protein